jgi:DtxR family transcriptional regulator, Mn-dependent transcriptional regulator
MSTHIEDYIKNIYKLQGEREKVTTSSIADALSVSAASVTDMIKKLSDRSLIKYMPYQGVELTHSGRKMALQTLRRHRLWEMFLVEFLNYTWDEVHDEAEKLEHIMSTDLEERIDKALGYPKHDPHGHPIPTRSSEIVEDDHPSLADLEINDGGVVVRVNDISQSLLQHMASIGIHMQSQIKVLDVVQFDGSMRVLVDDNNVFVSRQVARNIFVDIGGKK